MMIRMMISIELLIAGGRSLAWFLKEHESIKEEPIGDLRGNAGLEEPEK